MSPGVVRKTFGDTSWEDQESASFKTTGVSDLEENSCKKCYIINALNGTKNHFVWRGWGGVGRTPISMTPKSDLEESFQMRRIRIVIS